MHSTPHYLSIMGEISSFLSGNLGRESSLFRDTYPSEEWAKPGLVTQREYPFKSLMGFRGFLSFGGYGTFSW